MRKRPEEKTPIRDKLDLKQRIDSMIDTIISLAQLNAKGGYYDHLCLEEIRRPFKDADVDILYDYQKILNLIGNKRMKKKNSLDKQLRKLL